MKNLVSSVASLALAIGWAAEEAAPPTPKWLYDITRVAYTDLPNIQSTGDWPEKLIEDCAKAKVQLLFSRAHSGEHWNELGWKSAFGKPCLLYTSDAAD
ncbi:MAG: hypothetical protein N2689_15340, partial [Verrucomicrobiae bacterium]|nr:hypothetical protein [Verrucomicrobiae bacterium]